jgi:hypothetical protein
MPDPIIGEPPVVPGPEGRPEHERAPKTTDWVVVDHVSGDGARSRLEKQHRELQHAGIPARIEHDHDGKLALEVHRDEEHRALEVIGRKHAHGAGASAHETQEERIEAEEKGALKGVFKLTTVVWFVVAIAVIFGLWYLFAFAFGFVR